MVFPKSVSPFMHAWSVAESAPSCCKNAIASCSARPDLKHAQHANVVFADHWPSFDSDHGQSCLLVRILEKKNFFRPRYGKTPDSLRIPMNVSWTASICRALLQPTAPHNGGQSIQRRRKWRSCPPFSLMRGFPRGPSGLRLPDLVSGGEESAALVVFRIPALPMKNEASSFCLPTPPLSPMSSVGRSPPGNNEPSTHKVANAQNLKNTTHCFPPPIYRIR